MIKITKDGITKYIKEKNLQEFKDLGFKVVEPKQHKPEPMEIKEDKTEEKPKADKK